MKELEKIEASVDRNYRDRDKADRDNRGRIESATNE